MITCNLNKPESTFDQIRKEYTKLKPTDLAMISTALIEAGRFASAVHDEVEYPWTPDQYGPLTNSFAREVLQVAETIEKASGPVKKRAAKAVEDEPVTLKLLLKPSLEAAEMYLNDRKDLRALLGDILKDGVEFLYLPTDVGWHWTLDRVNWSILTDGKMGRRINFSAEFVEPHISVELGPGGKRKKPRAKAKK